MCSARCIANNCAADADSGVYVRDAANGNRLGSPKTWTWQSQACSGTSKPTGVIEGGVSAELLSLSDPVIPLTAIPARNPRRDSIGRSFYSCGIFVRNTVTKAEVT